MLFAQWNDRPLRLVFGKLEGALFKPGARILCMDLYR